MNRVLERLAERKRQPRSFGSSLARLLLPRSIAFASLAAALLVGNAMAVDPLAAPADASVSPAPTWSSSVAAANPGCVDAGEWPEGQLADAVVVHDFAQHADLRLAFDRAWDRNHNDTEVDDVWVVGVCP